MLFDVCYRAREETNRDTVGYRQYELQVNRKYSENCRRPDLFSPKKISIDRDIVYHRQKNIY